MADESTDSNTDPRQPVLRPGRPADQPPSSEPAEAGGAVVRRQRETPEQPTTEVAATVDESEHDAGAEEAPDDETDAEEEADVMARQMGRRRLLRQCERVLLLDFDRLSIPDWPTNFEVISARRRRDLWLAFVVLSAVVFLAGIPGFVPAWIAGGGFGVFVLILLAGVPFVRRLFSSQPTYLELVLRRHQRLREGRMHVEHLEGHEGLAWQCAMMADFNPALRSTRFSSIVRLSEQRQLARHIRRRDHLRLYLIFLMEAEKAYHRLQNAYFEGHQQAIDEGWVVEEVSSSEDADDESTTDESDNEAGTPPATT
ncbi:hypothetical protein C8D92_107182 [Tamilnaduibacter salinus]|uniref:Uncharacterized protein n=1 Tax=Tamilnaduibacter salinus TaxID=1484056 RepID=A0A2U1CVE5_9GAMM|nr:hypothetical protein [Tamilnaduibacter salinus]PVY75459.1 hypothetical protein C8D92_107182 [Tamilnaduibacter salinus]